MCYRLPDRFRNFFLSKERAVFRFDPVPGTGKKNWHFGHFYKTACCTQERRLHGDPDHREYSRGGRFPTNLPNAWDDYPKSRTWGYKSWKRVKKKKQWMKKGDNIMFPTFTPLGAESSTVDVEEGIASQKKKSNYNIKYGKDFELDAKEVSPPEEDYVVFENQKNPERDAGKPGIRKRIDPVTGLPLEGIELEEIDVPEDTTPVAEDDALKHGIKNKYRIGGDEGKRGTDMK